MKVSILGFAVLSIVLGNGVSAAADAKFQAFKIGSYDAVALKDGDLQEPNDGKSFLVGQPTADVAAILQGAGLPGDHFELSIQPLLVHAGKRVLLFDTGAGSFFGDIAGKLPGSLAAAHEDPAKVTDIFISHAHGDHIGGLVTPAGALAFPNATIHMSAPEWKWLSGMSPEFAKNFGIANVTTFVSTIRPKVAPFEPGAHVLPGVLDAVPIKGHTPGHCAYRITSGSNTLLVVGDALHSSIVSVRKPEWHIAFDGDQPTGAASRAALVSQSAASGQRLYVEHFPFPGVGKIIKDKSGYTWVPEPLH
jgi:glyoxylase-like metal-dependent hydrolase (beta-lactamase superfamily II)